MPYVPESPYESPYAFDLNIGTEVDILAYQARLALWHSGAPITLDGGIVVGKVHMPEEQTADLLYGLPEEYAQVSIPGTDSPLSLPERRFKFLSPKAKAVVYGLHAAFREIVRLDAERSGLLAPNAMIGGTNIGMYSGEGEDDWHCDGWLPPSPSGERSDQLFGNGLLRYTFSFNAPGTELLVGRLQKSQIIDSFLLDESTEIGSNGLENKPHAACEVVRFVSDHDVHRAPRLRTPVGRYFTTASVLLPLTESCQVQSPIN